VDYSLLVALWGALRENHRVGAAILKQDKASGAFQFIEASRAFANIAGLTIQELKDLPSLAGILSAGTLERDRMIAGGDVFITPVFWRLSGISSLSLRIPFTSAEQRFELALELPALED
jgi:hypothetical protein